MRLQGKMQGNRIFLELIGAVGEQVLRDNMIDVIPQHLSSVSYFFQLSSNTERLTLRLTLLVLNTYRE